mmetsp:Transcript_48641/g.147956  ORF Transcript_48641/g.147956 Transcript_48641/m.147956 type:complete len:336 (-) Transcript_48641:349-1356(-)
MRRKHGVGFVRARRQRSWCPLCDISAGDDGLDPHARGRRGDARCALRLEHNDLCTNLLQGEGSLGFSERRVLGRTCGPREDAEERQCAITARRHRHCHAMHPAQPAPRAVAQHVAHLRVGQPDGRRRAPADDRGQGNFVIQSPWLWQRVQKCRPGLHRHEIRHWFCGRDRTDALCFGVGACIDSGAICVRRSGLLQCHGLACDRGINDRASRPWQQKERREDDGRNQQRLSAPRPHGGDLHEIIRRRRLRPYPEPPVCAFDGIALRLSFQPAPHCIRPWRRVVLANPEVARSGGAARAAAPGVEGLVGARGQVERRNQAPVPVGGAADAETAPRH